jgi:RimJ/RimL family protein N-acetyltransferase
MIDVPTLTDGAVTLRRHHDGDVDRLLEQCIDSETIRWTTVPIGYTRDDAKRFVREITPGGWETGAEWAFAVEADGRYAGTVVIRPSEEGIGEIAFAAHPDVRGTGVMRRACLLLIDHAFARGLRSLIWWAHVGNWGSRKLVASVGFQVEGTVRQALGQRGELRDAWVGTLLPEDPRDFRTPWLTVPTLSGEGLVLRAMTQADVPRIVEACSDERTQHWLGRLPHPYSAQSALTYLHAQRESRATDAGVSWAVTEPGDDRLVAAISFFDHTRGLEAEIGYWAHPEARGRGVTSRALRLVTAYCFDELGLEKVNIAHAVDNEASRHVIESCGFREYGVERLGTQVLTGRVDLVRFDLLAEEWRSAAR